MCYNENDSMNHFEHVHEYGKAYVHVEVQYFTTNMVLRINYAKNHFEHVHEYGKAYMHLEVL